MKSFLKIFTIAFICFTLLFAGVVLAIFKMPHKLENQVNPEPDPIPSVPKDEETKKAEKTELQKLVEKSDRINVLLMGLEGTRTDTLILASFDPKSKNVDLISIPRDTYYKIKGYDAADQKKINAIYGHKKSSGGGPQGVMQAVANILKVPVHHYVTMSYKGVENIVDSLGGVKVTIPFDMNYDDPYHKPPLHIHLKKGTRVLNGKQAIQFLRFRQNNDKSHSDGDIGRIKRQRQFITAAAKKALSFKLPVVARTAFQFVKTSMELDDIVYYAKNAIGMSMDNISTYTLPGKPKGISYYFYDPAQTEKLMIEIYKKGSEED
ncbi:LCP family protein [Paramaledivibacter caminithermalis]|jgi:LCP family protein required for cell wall assembly|uniref:Transcriptional attenuator, LytR family n=1 Tax=Paramaledivibacter caminithermalis (strain DSM 15212 / CIP 107654 / DViRD3) TaxID=1121301 RepID=A0A1M6QMB1_PARC5|nr:LCP family protein [Paramaledivibacter caminithermalis]SHK21308.1 transcriptional attenuator, LytR family [Paramaledivibacter caminithermalis DSM 15212]